MTSRTTRAIVPYTADQMYALVADIERYPDFLPWCVALRVVERRREEGRDIAVADMVVSYRVFRERFRSRAVMDPVAKTVETEYIDGPFRHLRNRWAFISRAEGGSTVAFEIDFEFRNFVLQATAQSVFDKAFSRMSEAFVKRADVVYGGAPVASA